MKTILLYLTIIFGLSGFHLIDNGARAAEEGDKADAPLEALRKTLGKKYGATFKVHAAGVMAIVTDGPDEVARSCIQNLFPVLPKMRVLAGFPSGARPPEKVLIVLFKRKDTFQKFVKDRSGHSLGSYTYIHDKKSSRKLIAAYVLPKQPMLARLRHVAFNMLLRAWIPEPPAWLNEGLAECMEDVELHGKELTLGSAHRHIKDLRERLLRGEQGKIISLRKLISLSAKKMRDNPFSNYTMAWGFCRYLLEDPLIKEAKLYPKILGALSAKHKEKENAKRVSQIFMKDEWSLIERSWRTYLKGVVETPAEAPFRKAREALAKGAYDQALPLLDQAVIQDLNYERLYYFRALVLANQKQDTLAVKDLEKALELYPEYTAAKFLRGQCLARLGFPVRARTDLEACLKSSYRSKAKKELDKLK